MAEAPLQPDALFRALAAADVDYVAIGGMAVNAHGVPRATFDVDVVVGRTPDNLERLARALDALEAPALVRDAGGFLELDPRDAFDLARGLVIRVPTRHGPLDLIAAPPGAAPFETLLARSLHLDVGGTPVWVVGRADLVVMKRAAGRPKDLLDLADLERELDP